VTRQFAMASALGCFTNITNLLGLVPGQSQPSTTAPEQLLAQHARDLAATDIALLDDRKQKEFQTTFLMHHLPELSQYNEVHFNRNFNYWLVHLWTRRVPKKEILPLPENIAACPVYHMQSPIITTDRFLSGTRPYLGMGIDGGGSDMTPADFLADPTDLPALIQAAFPSSIGIRLHPWHYIDILYPTRRALKKEARAMTQGQGIPPNVCYQQFDMKVWNDKVKLPGTVLVRFDPEKKMEVMEWMEKAREYHRIRDEEAGRDAEGAAPTERLELEDLS
jgi:hypothetical protein